MTNPLETHDKASTLLKATHSQHPRRVLRKLRAQAEQESSRRETLLRNAYSRAKRATDSAVARNSYRLRIAREHWQRAVDEGR